MTPFFLFFFKVLNSYNINIINILHQDTSFKFKVTEKEPV